MLRLPERIHKRPFVVSIIVFFTLLLVSGALIISLGLFGSNSDLPTVHISSVSAGDTGNEVKGVGLNLSYLPTSNLLKNPSFEDLQFDQVYTVSGGTENAVYVQSDSETDTFYEDGFFVDGTVRIMSLNEAGQLVPKMQAAVTTFRTNQLGLWTPLTVPSGAAEGQNVTSLSSSATVSVAVGDKGLLISDITSSEPTIIDLGISGNFVSSSGVSDRFYAVTETGSFAFSADGITWNVFSPDTETLYAMNTVSSIGKIGIASGDEGTILLCSGGEVTSILSGTSQDLLSSASDGSTMIIAGTDGEILTTSNGVFFRELKSDELPSFITAPNWQCADYRNGQFILGGDQGQIAIGTYSADTGLFSFSSHLAVNESGNPLSLSHIMLLSTGEIVIMDRSGSLYCSNDGGNTWKLLTVNSTKEINEIGQTSTGKIILSQGVTSQTTQLYTCIEFDDVQSENIFQAGDMCFLQRSVASQSLVSSDESSDAALAIDSSFEGQDDLWVGMGDATAIQMQDAAPSGGGSSSLHMTGSVTASGDQSHYASQVIAGAGSSPFQNSTIYQIKVWLKQDGIKNGEVMSWISGNFTSLGTTFTDVGSSWRQYTYTFFAPSAALGEDFGEIRFNIGFTGEGVLDIDKVYFGLESNADSSLPASFTESISDVLPVLIRLDNVGLGRMGVSSEAWELTTGNEGIIRDGTVFKATGCNSLEASLALVSAAKSDPWLVIGSAASQTTIDNLMGYLCGSISDPYGKLRMENGTAVPWSIQFSHLTIEISDPDGIFSTDLQRGAYVDYIMNSIQSSPYYVDIKDKFSFIDGMVYDGGTMLSEADFHTSSLSVSNLSQTEAVPSVLSFDEAVSAGYATYFDSLPRTPSTLKEGAVEWIRSCSLSILQTAADDSKETFVPDAITAADYVEALLSDLGDHTYIVMADLPVSQSSADVDTALMFGAQGSTKAEKTISASNNMSLLNVCSLLCDSVKGQPITSSVLKAGTAIESTADISEEITDAESTLTTYAYEFDSQIRAIVANTGDLTELFLLEADWSLKGEYVYRYSSEGVFIEKIKLGQRNNRISLLPGQIIIAKITAQ